MSAKRVGMHRLQELVRLHRMNTGCRRIARLLKMSPNTERDYRLVLSEAGLLDGPMDELPELEVLKQAILQGRPKREGPQQASSVEAWDHEIERLVSKNVGPRAIYDFLRLEHEDFTGSLSAVKRRYVRFKRERGIAAEDVAIPVETAPGEVAQVDFGYVGRLYDAGRGVLRKAWVFVMVLGFSRHMFARVVFDQCIETWLRLHGEAFSALGGVVEVVVPDNLKAAVIRAAFGLVGDTSLNRSYREMARHYGLKIDPTPVRCPEKKGKVESAVKYVKNSFFRPRELPDIDEANRQLSRWVQEIAGRRIHGTTGKQPLAVFEAVERCALRALPLVPFEPVVWKKATVHPDSHVAFDRRLYSVPWHHIGRKVWIRATASTVYIHVDDTRIATHRRRGQELRSTVDGHLPEHRNDLRHRSRTYWEERADRLGQAVGEYIREVFDSDDVLSRLRAVQATVTHLEQFPRERACAACERARYFGNYSYQGIKAILRKALDLQPLPTADPAGQDPVRQPRYARTAMELVQLPLETSHEPN